MVLVIVWLSHVILTEINGSRDRLAEPGDTVINGSRDRLAEPGDTVINRSRDRSG